MNRGIRTLLVVAVAVTVATLATLAVYRAVQRIPVREVEQAGIPVVVAARNLPIGTMLTRADLTVANWPARSPLAGGFASPDELVNRGLIADMVANEPIINAKLAPANSGAGLPPTIPEGMRAISVQVNEVVGVAGFVTPGNHVDVVATISRQDNSHVPRRRQQRQGAGGGHQARSAARADRRADSDHRRHPARDAVRRRTHRPGLGRGPSAPDAAQSARRRTDDDHRRAGGGAARFGRAAAAVRKSRCGRRRVAPRRRRRRQSRWSRKSTRWKRSAPPKGPRRSSSDRS